MISARNYWTTAELWADFHYWTNRAHKQRHPEKNYSTLRASASMMVLRNRKPGLYNPDAHARVAIEHGWQRPQVGR